MLMISDGGSHFEQLAGNHVFVGDGFSQRGKIMPGIGNFKHSLLFKTHFDLAIVECADPKTVE